MKNETENQQIYVVSEPILGRLEEIVAELQHLIMDICSNYSVTLDPNRTDEATINS